AAFGGDLSRSDRKQAEILSWCSKVIAEEGYEKASIRKIAEEMGMSISALYYYFSSKKELLFAIQYNAFRDLVRRLEEKLGDVREPERKLYVLIENHLEYFLSRLDELTICSHETNTLKGRAYQRVWEIRRRYYNIALGIVREIRASRGGPGLQPSLATLNLFGMLNWIYMWFNPKKNRSYRVLAQEICDLFLNGISSKGRSATGRDRSDS
ncbi:MAG: TetR/AcrR family transcriptional regulator, partial [Planctomycetes bacterium]|nr:TetR/AcrR family transcriptional regulator [Planctomycetota bacterium]